MFKDKAQRAATCKGNTTKVITLLNGLIIIGNTTQLPKISRYGSLSCKKVEFQTIFQAVDMYS